MSVMKSGEPSTISTLFFETGVLIELSDLAKLTGQKTLGILWFPVSISPVLGFEHLKS